MSEFYNFYSSLFKILYKTRQKALAAINFAAMKTCSQISRRIIKKLQRFENICILQIQFTRSCPFLSVFHSYAEKELAV